MKNKRPIIEPVELKLVLTSVYTLREQTSFTKFEQACLKKPECDNCNYYNKNKRQCLFRYCFKEVGAHKNYINM